MMILEELRMTCYIFGVSFMGYIIGVIFMGIGMEMAFQFSIFVWWLFSVSAPSFVATLWVPTKIKKLPQWSRMNWRHSRPQMLDTGLFKDRKKKANGMEIVTVIDELLNLFLDEKKMKFMMQWAIRAFCVESLIAFVEFVQFKEKVISIIKGYKGPFVGEKEIPFRYEFYGHCPKSSIVFDGDKPMSLGEALENGAIALEHGGIDAVKIDLDQRQERALDPIPEIVIAENKSSGKVMLNQMMMAHALGGGGKSQDNNELKCEEEKIELKARDIHRFRKCAHLLYGKYLAAGAPLEVNTCWDTRRRYYALEQMDYVGLSPMEWVGLYDEVLWQLERYILENYDAMIRKLHDMEQKAKRK